jgi:hypothetical protein
VIQRSPCSTTASGELFEACRLAEGPITLEEPAEELEVNWTTGAMGSQFAMASTF